MAFRDRSQVDHFSSRAHVLFIPPLFTYYNLLLLFLCHDMPPQKVQLALLSIFGYLLAVELPMVPIFFLAAMPVFLLFLLIAL